MNGIEDAAAGRPPATASAVSFNFIYVDPSLADILMNTAEGYESCGYLPLHLRTPAPIPGFFGPFQPGRMATGVSHRAIHGHCNRTRP